jgi:hyperosmotically inducible periplasmic protein
MSDCQHSLEFLRDNPEEDYGSFVRSLSYAITQNNTLRGKEISSCVKIHKRARKTMRSSLTPGLRILYCLSLCLQLSSWTMYAQFSTNSKPDKIEITEPLARALRHQLLMLPYYSVFDAIDFSISGKTVTLTGQVLRPTLKAHAEATARSLEGVGAVVNKIEVLPHSATDNELRRAVYRGLFEDPELAKYAIQAVPPIHIIVKNGTVTLVGKVDQESDISLAGRETSKVMGVAGVRNLLTVHKIDLPAN